MSDKQNIGDSPGPYGLLHLGRGTFGDAIRALKDGHMVARRGWNGKGLFVFMQVPAEIDREIVPNMQSLPLQVKLEFERRFSGQILTNGKIKYSNQLALVKPNNEINGWSPSTPDALADDWEIIGFRYGEEK